MLHYRLDDLHWQEFERLCQAVLKAHFGVGVEAWGGSGDWGNDAYCQAPLRYPGSDLQEGPFQFQVKFVAGANAAGAKPGPPLLQAVKRECQRIERRSQVPPRVYSLLTNVVVSGELRKTIEEAIRKVLPSCEFVLTHGGDDISLWLQAHRDVVRMFPQLLSHRDLSELISQSVERTAVVVRAELRQILAGLYDTEAKARMAVSDAGIEAERISFSGNAQEIWFSVLKEAGREGPAALFRIREVAHQGYPDAVPSPTPPPAEPNAGVRAYLDWAWRHHRLIRPLGYHNQEKIQISLDEMFVNLVVRTGHETHAAADKGAATGGSSTRSDLEGIVAEAELREKVGVAIIGDPGAGKSTLLKHLLCRVASEGSAVFGLPAGLTPVFLKASRFSETSLRPNTLREHVSRQVADQGYPDAGREFGRSERALLILLDGLDEVSDEPQRVRLCEWLDNEVHHLHTCRFFVTCRVQAWHREARLSNQFLQANVQWLTPELIDIYVRRWYLAVELGDGRSEALAITQATDLLSTLSSSRAQHGPLRAMSANPMLLSVLCLAHRSGQGLPERRAKLFKECIAFLLEVWPRERDGAPLLDAGAAGEVLRPLAWAMQCTHSRDFSAAQVRAVIARPLRGIRGLDLTTDRFIERVSQDCGLLTGIDVDRFEFLHLSFQEFLAAEHAAVTGQGAFLADRLGEPSWRETVLLSMSFPGVFLPFMERVIRTGRICECREVLQECLEEVSRFDPRPFVAALRPPDSFRGRLLHLVPWRRRSSPREIACLLSLLTTHNQREISEAARPWSNHRDSEVARAARAVAGGGGPEAARPIVDIPSTPQAGFRWREPETGIWFCGVPPGSFWMGASKRQGEGNFDPEAYDDETPPHSVRFERGFWLGQHPVTNETYRLFLEANGGAPPPLWGDSRFNRPKQPVVGVTWHNAKAFCAWLNGRAPAAWSFDLPTEAQWEYSARGPHSFRYPWGADDPTPTRAVWGRDAETDGPAVVGGRPAGASPFGCEDMAGNIDEWCRDFWTDPHIADDGETGDPGGVGNEAAPRVVRGGSWAGRPAILRSSARFRLGSTRRREDLGFRVVLEPTKAPAALASASRSTSSVHRGV